MTENLDDIIEFENENTELDFKAIQYQKVKFQDLLKDLMSMANAKTDADKYIIVGVKLLGNGNRDILGITEDFIDEATYQQLVHNNIEPELNFSYVSYQFQNKTLGVFKIFDSIDRPYMMKKDFGKLRIGEAFIRKGSHQTRLTRKDFDFYTEKKITEKKFKGKIHTYFDEINQKSIALKVLSNGDYPSGKAAEKIKKILLEKKEKLKKNEGMFVPFFDQDIPMLGGTPYENRSIKTLEGNLENVAETYRKDDLHYLFEVKAHKFNFTILNDDTEYLEDASIELKIEKEGLYIADKIYSKPDNSNSIISLKYELNPPSWESMNYPEVMENETEYLILENLGNLKHQISGNALKVDLRIAINPKLNKTEKIVKIKIFGKNLSKPIEDQLIIQVTE
ncbi:AlbA family DNA-binding domain-containing protein [Flavobacterium beibuense]|uniref:AlbA family DNA-binding domain-containing protein n=1 Tax=Flavobacterium beibuense TaxID=657326 RepID=UPI00069070C8|nr:ATP-binding protein [Flavobacterium beibuense]